ncbi:MAG: hypothetical protein FJZ96_06845 [Chloroflexi bacterium]|nr:hypothetical protein [Chloroflexota bacterium]
MSLLDTLAASPVWFVNGILYLLYWLAGHVAEVFALFFGIAIALGIDPAVQGRASERPRRYERGGVQTAAPAATYFTLGVLLLWLIVSAISKFPIPTIGAVMWFVGLLSILAVSEERVNQLWWVKTGILVYAILVLLLRFGLQALQGTNPSDWATVLGSSADAQIVINQTRSNVAMIGMLFVLVLYPVGFAAMLLNRFIRNPKPLYNIWREAGEVLERLRTRT